MVRPCTQCGKCCKTLLLGSIHISETEDWVGHPVRSLADWAQAGLAGVDSSYVDLWINPRTGEEPERCPWLKKSPDKPGCYNCRIHDVRPSVCRDYPVDAEQAINHRCEMIEAADIGRPLAELNQELDLILGRRGQ